MGLKIRPTEGSAASGTYATWEVSRDGVDVALLNLHGGARWSVVGAESLAEEERAALRALAAALDDGRLLPDVASHGVCSRCVAALTHAPGNPVDGRIGCDRCGARLAAMT